MAEKKFYVGSHGPFLYDNEDLIDDPDGDFAGRSQRAFVSEESPVFENLIPNALVKADNGKQLVSTKAVPLIPYDEGSLPDPSEFTNHIVCIEGTLYGTVLAFSDGSNWRLLGIGSPVIFTPAPPTTAAPSTEAPWEAHIIDGDIHLSEGDRTKLNSVGTNAYGNRTVSTLDPSGGEDGDVWLKIEA